MRQLLLPVDDLAAYAWSFARYVDCPRCDGMGVFITDMDRCFCVSCGNRWDRVNVRGPVVRYATEDGRLEMAR